MNFRDLTTALNFRQRIREFALRTFGGKRNVMKTLGYKEFLDVADYRARFARNEGSAMTPIRPVKDGWA